jgi:hypothetical protein
MTDGTLECNAERYRLSTFYDLPKMSVIRLAFAHSRTRSRNCAARPGPVGQAARSRRR